MRHRHLVEVNEHIADGEKRVARQQELIDRLSQNGHDTSKAEILLDVLRDSLETRYQYREAILYREAVFRKFDGNNGGEPS